jgi:hypothetical protein
MYMRSLTSGFDQKGRLLEFEISRRALKYSETNARELLCVPAPIMKRYILQKESDSIPTPSCGAMRSKAGTA